MSTPLLILERLLLLILLLLLLNEQRRFGRKWWKNVWEKGKEKKRRRWHPKSPKDCPGCCGHVRLERHVVAKDVIPWSERKSSRGRKKRVPTKGYGCPDPSCEYYGITDESIHAVVADGKRGLKKEIQYLKCQWCGCSFSSRKNTPLYYLKSSESQVKMVLWFLAEGVDISVMVRYTGRSEATITRWLMRMGSHSQALHNRYLHHLVLKVVQLDELYAKVRTGVQWLWLAIDAESKLIPSLHLGGRKQEDGFALVHDLHLRLEEETVPTFTSDGLRHYFYALNAHFGYWFRPERARTDHWAVSDALHYGQLVKRTKRRRLVYTITRMMTGKRSALYQVLVAQGFAPNIQTAYIERVNLSIRRGVAPLMRKTWSLTQSPEHLLLHVEWWRAYYHFVRPHQSLGSPRRNPQTPAMAADITDRVWSVSDILHHPLYPLPPG